MIQKKLEIEKTQQRIYNNDERSRIQKRKLKLFSNAKTWNTN